MNPKTAARGFIALLSVIAAFGLFHQVGGLSAARAACDAGTIRYYAQVARNNGQEDVARYRFQEAAACNTITSAVGPPPSAPASPPPSVSARSTSSPTSAPTSPAPASPAPEMTDKPAGQSWEFLANRPADEKVGINAYGPKMSIYPLRSVPMESLGRDSGYEELKYRMSVDPMLTAANAAAAGFIGYGKIDEQTKLYASDRLAWDEMRARVLTQFDGMSRRTETIKAGVPFTALYALPGDVPLVRKDGNVTWQIPVKFLVFRGENGNEIWLRLECGFQQYWFKAAPVAIPDMPEPSPGMDRTPEGEPVPEKPKPSPSPSVTPSPSTSPSTSPSPAPSPSGSPSETPSTPPPTTPPPTTPPPTTPPPADECPDKPGVQPPGFPCPKEPAPQPTGVEKPDPDRNPVGPPEARPSTKPTPLTPDPPSQSPSPAPSDGNEAEAPNQGGEPTQSTDPGRP